MKLSIIITSWNTRELLRGCLRSIREHAPSVPFETIVVDNGSKDGSAEMVEKEFPEVRIIAHPVNSGYAGGNNIGYRASSGEYLLLLGSDTVMHPGSIATLVRALDDRPAAGIIACRLLQPDGSLQASCKTFPSVLNAVAMYASLHFLNRSYLMQDFDHRHEREVDQPDATCIIIRRTALGETIFDERFSILYNDVDLCQRVKKGGWRIIFIPTAEVTHYGSQSTKQAPAAVRLVMYRNILLYYRIHFGAAARFLLTPLLVLRFFLATRQLRGFSLFGPLSAELP